MGHATIASRLDFHNKMTTVTIMTYPEVPDRNWSVAEAKARFSEVIKLARTEAPQVVTHHGQPAVVVVSAEEWARKTKRRGSLVDFLSESPLKGAALDLTRPKEKPRSLEL
jgi:prevent-host-death family protein